MTGQVVPPVNPDERAGASKETERRRHTRFHPLKSYRNILYTRENNIAKSQSDTIRNERDTAQRNDEDDGKKKLSGTVTFALVWHPAPDWSLTR